jgi:hypothetical protein
MYIYSTQITGLAKELSIRKEIYFNYITGNYV